MKLPTPLISPIRRLVLDLVRSNLDGLSRDGRIGRLTVNELRRAISQYGRTLTDPPEAAFEQMEALPVSGMQQAWAVDFDLWTIEEGQSDLTLSLKVFETYEGPKVEIEDLHVL